MINARDQQVELTFFSGDLELLGYAGLIIIELTDYFDYDRFYRDDSMHVFARSAIGTVCKHRCFKFEFANCSHLTSNIGCFISEEHLRGQNMRCEYNDF